MEQKNVLVSNVEPILSLTVDRLRKIANVTSVFQSAPGYIEYLNDIWLKRLKDVHVLVANITINEKILKAAPNLLYVQRYGIGYDNVDVDAATKHGVIVCNIGEIMAESVAQHTLALILALSKDIVLRDKTIRGQAPKQILQGILGFELWEKTLGIVGLGSIGKRVALKCRLAFNMKILAYDPWVLSARAQLFGTKLVDLKTLLKNADVVVLSCPLTPETHHLIGKDELNYLKKSSIIVNTSRGAVINQIELIRHLQEQKIRGAGLDVTDPEPVPKNSPLLKLNNVILTGHTAGPTVESIEKTTEAYISNVERYLQGKKPHWIINPEAFKFKK
jgi:D-3-phosphoglycerate dehydrogenase